MHALKFYTYWAVVLHVLYVIGLIPNTSIIAIVVLVVSQIFVWIRPGHIHQLGHRRIFWVNEVIFHRLPIVLFDDILISRTTVGLASVTLLLYGLYHRKSNIKSFYADLSGTIYDIWET